MTESKPHSEREFLEGLRYEDKFPDADRVVSELTTRIRELEEQLEALREEHRELTSAAMRLCNVHRWSYGGPGTLRALADRIAEASTPAISPRPTMPLGSSGRSDISARADDGHYCIGPDCPDCAPASRPS